MTPLSSSDSAAGLALLPIPPMPGDAQEMADLRRRIDQSCAAPCIAFFASSLFWLLFGSLAALVASLKMHHPNLLADIPWLTFGRVRPVHLTVVAFGWSSMAGIGTMLWLMCRLSRVELKFGSMLIVAAVIWNLGVAAGVYGILAGHSLGIEWLEFPTYAAFLLFVAFAIVNLWAVTTFARRRCEHVYVSQWYLFGALFWFPWLYATVQILLILMPVKGVTQATINWWFGHNVLGVWFTPIGLATVYYLLPKVIGRPIHSYYLSILGFWSLALFYNWAGAHHLISGPVPAWMQTVSIVGSVMMFIPVISVALNHHLTMRGNFHLLKHSPTLRFIVYGAMCYTAVSLQGSLMSIPAINEPTHFTHYTIAHAHFGLYAFFSMVMFGAMYYIIPRLTGREWSSVKLIKAHFWFCGLGFALMFLSLTIGGLIQGFEMNQATASLNSLIAKQQQTHGWFYALLAGTRDFFAGFKAQNGAVPFMDTVRTTVPYLAIRSVSGIMMTLGHLAFFVLVVRNVHAWGKAATDGPTLLGSSSSSSLPTSANLG